MNPRKWQKEIIAWENGETIQVKDMSEYWYDIYFPSWNEDLEYRIKPKEEFKWQKEKDHWENGGKVQFEWRIKPEPKIEYSFDDKVKGSIKNVIIKVEDKTKLSIEIIFN